MFKWFLQNGAALMFQQIHKLKMNENKIMFVLHECLLNDTHKEKLQFSARMF